MYEFSKVPRWLVNIFLFFDDLQSSYRAYEAPQGDRRVKKSAPQAKFFLYREEKKFSRAKIIQKVHDYKKK